MKCPHCGMDSFEDPLGNRKWIAACGSDNILRSAACREIQRLKDEVANKDDEAARLKEVVVVTRKCVDPIVLRLVDEALAQGVKVRT